MKALESMHVEYGYFEGEIHQSSGKPIAELAALLNDGYGNTPARPFVDDAIDAMDRWFQVNRDWSKDLWLFLKDGGRVDSFYIKYGKVGADAIRRMIDVNDYADNIDWWEDLKRKKYGVSIPLMETGELYDSAKYKIIRGSK